MSATTAETSTLAEYLRDDLQRITRSANDELRKIRLADMPEFVRRAEEARVIEDARARAVRRVESAIRHVHAVQPGAPPDGAGLETTQIIPVVTEAAPAPPEAVAAADEEEHDASEGRHRASEEAIAGPRPGPTEKIPVAARASESDDERLQRLLAFVVHQEPRLNWAIGDRPDGSTVLVTDFAHGWIPPGIALPEGVRLLEPGRRTGKVAALVGETRRARTYAPGDSLGRLNDFAETAASAQPRELPAVDGLGWELSQATHWRDGLPRMVHTLARAAAAGTGVAEEEIDLLRVHLDTARYQLVIQYPNIDPALFLNCLLLAATEGAVAGDLVSANYHLAWFHKLNEPAGAL